MRPEWFALNVETLAPLRRQSAIQPMLSPLMAGSVLNPRTNDAACFDIGQSECFQPLTANRHSERSLNREDSRKGQRRQPRRRVYVTKALRLYR